MTVIFSDMPDAIDPFLFVFIENPGSSGGRMTILCGMGARFIIFITAV